MRLPLQLDSAQIVGLVAGRRVELGRRDSVLQICIMQLQPRKGSRRSATCGPCVEQLRPRSRAGSMAPSKLEYVRFAWSKFALARSALAQDDARNVRM